jgi:SAM-dependent methyltransferase
VSSGPSTNPNPACYEALAPCYEGIYGQIDARETVRQWRLLLAQLDLAQLASDCLSLVDIGCGPGWHLEAWAEVGYHVAGLDASPSMLEQARRRLTASGHPAEFYLADLRNGGGTPAGVGFDLAVSHFNFPNLFPPEERGALFRAAARWVRPGGYWMLDFSEPNTLENVEDETYTCEGKLLHRSGRFNPAQGRYEQRWRGYGIDCTEYLWFDFFSQAETLARRTGWRLHRRMAWLPYQPEQPWRPIGEDSLVFVDTYQRLGEDTWGNGCWIASS